VVPGEKNEGRALTVHEPITEILWEQHLAGELGLGAVPARDDGTCTWAAIDVDDYRLDLPGLVRRVAKAALPLLVIRTKSGGAHLYIFFAEKIICADARALLARFTKKLRLKSVDARGEPTDCEIFPKQDKVGADNAGSWINLPYQSGDRSLRYAFDPVTAVAISAEDFLDLTYDRALSKEQIEGWFVEGRDVVDDLEEDSSKSSTTSTEDPRWPGAPPCLTQLLRLGVVGGTRNETLFNLVLYLKRADEATAESRAIELARTFEPPMNEQEARQTTRAALRRPYNYRCRNPPLVGVCDRSTCLTRAHGVAGHALAPGEDRTDARTRLTLGTLCKILLTPPTWVWDVNGFRVELTTEQLLNQRLFLIRVFEESNLMGVPVRPANWATIVAKAAAEAPQLKPPPDATEAGLVWVTLARFCTSKAQAKTIDELLMGKPFTTHGRTFFCASDFLAYCHQQQTPATARNIFRWLHERGLAHAVLDLKGKQTDVWSVPEFTGQTIPFLVPRDPDAGAAF
jgi:hypothetical protein